MPGSSIGEMFRVSTFGESHGPALGCVIDGCPPGLALCEADLQVDLDRRRPGTSKYATQRQEADQVKILSGVFEGVTTGTSIGLMIENEDQKSKATVSQKIFQEKLAKNLGKIETEIEKASVFYPAESYHQNFYQKKPMHYANYYAQCGREDRLKNIWPKEVRESLLKESLKPKK